MWVVDDPLQFLLGNRENDLTSGSGERSEWHEGKRLTVGLSASSLTYSSTSQACIYTESAPYQTWQMWRLIPVPSPGIAEPGSLPLYDGDPGVGTFTRTQHAGSESDKQGTFVNEVTVITTTVTTRKRYKVEDA